MSVSKIVAAAASGVGGGDLDVDDVFSTFLYDGNGGTQSIVNNIDLSGEGGLVWIKCRNVAFDHKLYDTERGIYYDLESNTNLAQFENVDAVTSFNSNGFSIDDDLSINDNPQNFVSWTFRKAPKFFDVVTFSATGSGSLTLSHNLGSTPAFIIVKSTSHAQSWYCYHHTLNGGTDPEDYFLKLDSNVAEAGPASSYWGGTAPTSTQFTVGTDLNISGRSYVAYLFAHNNNDGEFGPDGDQDIIKCGSYTGDGSATGPEINLGFEPQWVMIKRTNSTGDFAIFDNMRGITSGGVDGYLIANSNQQEYQIEFLQLLSNGFQPTSTNSNVNASGSTYIYMAIRRGPLAVPDDATKVFDVYEGSDAYPTVITTGFTVDFLLGADRSGSSNNFISGPRLTGSKSLKTNSTDSQGNALFSTSPNACFMRNDGILPSTFGQSDTVYYSWKRAPSYFDCVAFKGNGVDGRTVDHAMLGVVPEMIWVKNRSATGDWAVYHKDLNGGVTPEQYYLYLNSSNAEAKGDFIWSDTAPTATQFTVGNSSRVNSNNKNYIAYLFATVDGVSKVGSYSGTGSDQNIDCGFSSGARFVLTKRYTGNGGWQVRDSARGITNASNDPWLELQGVNAEYQDSNMDIDPLSSGFTVSGADIEINASGHSYIFYAIA